MSEDNYNRMQWCNKKLIDTREELDNTRRMNEHLNNTIDRKIKQLDEVNGKLQQINDAIRDSCTGRKSEGLALDDVKYIVGWERKG